MRVDLQDAPTAVYLPVQQFKREVQVLYTDKVEDKHGNI